MARRTNPRRILLFGCAAAAAVGAILATNAAAADLDAVSRITGLWFAIPVLAASSLVVRPGWVAAVAGIAAGGLIGESMNGNVIVTAGAGMADVLGFVGLVSTLAFMSARLVRIFPAAMAELRARGAARRTPHAVECAVETIPADRE